MPDKQDPDYLDVLRKIDEKDIDVEEKLVLAYRYGQAELMYALSVFPKQVQEVFDKLENQLREDGSID